jgi:hypothetical protein
MIEVSANEDAALRYVLGEGGAAERREFESRLAVSGELQTLVHELETGMVALANAAPRRRPPAEVWQRIEKTVTKKSPWKLVTPFFAPGWCRDGWAVAAMCVVGWLTYAFVIQHRHAAALTELKKQPAEVVVATSVSPSSAPAYKIPAADTNIALALLQGRRREIEELQRQVAALQLQTTRLSRTLDQQSALLGETNRIKFYHLVSTPPSGGNATLPPLSPGLQRAVATALARDLGWLPATQSNGAPGPAVETINGVDFINLRTAQNNSTGQPPATPPIQSPNPISNQAQIPSQAGSVTADTIPAYVSGNNLNVAVDPTLVPAGSSVTFTVADANQNQTGGTITMGENPTVVTIPLSDDSMLINTSGGYAVTVSSVSPGGQVNTTTFFTASP